LVLGFGDISLGVPVRNRAGCGRIGAITVIKRDGNITRSAARCGKKMKGRIGLVGDIKRDKGSRRCC